METLLLSLIVLLTLAICALAGLWFYRAEQARRRAANPPQPLRQAAKQDHWEAAIRASRERI